MSDPQAEAQAMLERMTRIRDEAAICTACDLKNTRTHVVFGEGNILSPIVIVGEGPGEDEDSRARPFIGRSGQLLSRILAEAGIKREDVWMTNIVKCRPTGMGPNGRVTNRPPRATEVKACQRWLGTELDIIRPRIIITLGNSAAGQIITKDFKMTTGRGVITPAAGPAIPPSLLPVSGGEAATATADNQISMFDMAEAPAEVPSGPTVATWALATYHPAYIIRQEEPLLGQLVQLTVNDLKSALIKLDEVWKPAEQPR